MLSYILLIRKHQTISNKVIGVAAVDLRSTPVKISVKVVKTLFGNFKIADLEAYYLPVNKAVAVY